MDAIARSQEAARLRALADEIEQGEAVVAPAVPVPPAAPKALTHRRRLGDLQSLLQAGPRGTDEVLDYLVNAVSELQERAVLAESSEHA